MRSVTLLCLALAMVAGNAHADMIVIDGTIMAETGYPTATQTFDDIVGYGAFDTASIRSASSASSWAEVTPSEFTSGFDLFMLPTFLLKSSSYSWLEFEVDVESTYSISGWSTGSDPDAGYVQFSASLRQSQPVPYEPDGNYLFFDLQRSSSTVDESFILFGTVGDDWNDRGGSPTGTLVPGETYTFGTGATIWKSQYGGVNDVTRAGGFTLNIVPIPEPGTGALLMVGLIGLAMKSR